MDIYCIVSTLDVKTYSNICDDNVGWGSTLKCDINKFNLIEVFFIRGRQIDDSN